MPKASFTMPCEGLKTHVWFVTYSNLEHKGVQGLANTLSNAKPWYDVPVASSVQAGVHTHVQIGRGVDDFLELGPLVAAAHPLREKTDKLHLEVADTWRVERGLTPSSHRCWRCGCPGSPAPPCSCWAVWHFSCDSPNASRRALAGGSPRWWAWQWPRGRRKWACWTCSPCCWAWPPPSPIPSRPPLRGGTREPETKEVH